MTEKPYTLYRHRTSLAAVECTLTPFHTPQQPSFPGELTLGLEPLPAAAPRMSDLIPILVLCSVLMILFDRAWTEKRPFVRPSEQIGLARPKGDDSPGPLLGRMMNTVPNPLPRRVALPEVEASFRCEPADA